MAVPPKRPKLTMLQPRVVMLDHSVTPLNSPSKSKAKWGDAGRQSAHERGYGWQWKRLRLQVLQRDVYRCQACKLMGRITPAAEVDHILNRALGGTDDLDNLQSLCVPCHLAKTQAEGGPR